MQTWALKNKQRYYATVHPTSPSSPSRLLASLWCFLRFGMLCTILRWYMRKSGKKYALFWLKKHWFLYWGAHSQNQLLWFCMLFYWRKNFCVHFERYIFFYTHFFVFLPFFAFDPTRQNREFLLTKGRLSKTHLAKWYPWLVPILIPKWGQKTTKARQDLHIPKYHSFNPTFLALFLHFSGFHVVNIFFSCPNL